MFVCMTLWAMHSSARCSFPCCCWPLMKRCVRQRRSLAARTCSLLASCLRDAARGSHWQLWDAGAGESSAGSLGKPHIYITDHHQTMCLTTGQIGCSGWSAWRGGGGHFPVQCTAVYRGFVLYQNDMVRWLVQMIDLLDPSFTETA